MTSVDIKQYGASVLIRLRDGQREFVTEMPWNVALDIVAALREKAKAAEEYATANNIIFDQALLIRSGAPFVLSDHPDIRSEAKKEAAHHPTLRKLPSIKSTEAVGVPTLIDHGSKRGDTSGKDS